MRRSMRTTSGARAPAISTATAPVSAEPDDLEVVDLGEHQREPAAVCGVVVRHEDADHRSTAALTALGGVGMGETTGPPGSRACTTRPPSVACSDRAGAS